MGSEATGDTTYRVTFTFKTQQDLEDYLAAEDQRLRNDEDSSLLPQAIF